MKQVLVSSCEFGLLIDMLFIDFKRSYDTTKRPKMVFTPEYFGFPKNIIKLIKTVLNNTKCKVLGKCRELPSKLCPATDISTVANSA